MDSFSLYASQASAVDWLSPRSYGMIAHEMGCGKTATTAVACKDRRRVLVVCPIAVGPTWPKQFALTGDKRPVCLAVEGPAAKRAARIREAVAGDGNTLVVVNYDAVWRGEIAKVISGTQWDAIVLDESHRIKSPTGKSSKWLAKLAERQPQALRLCLTGTPTPHSPLDWWAQFRFLDPAVLGCTYPAYRNRIAITHPRYPGWVTGFKAEGLDALRERIDQHIHRVTAEEVLTLPEAIHSVIEVTLGPKARKFYDEIENDMVSYLNGEPVTAANQLVVASKLRTAAGGYAKVDGTHEFEFIDGTPDKSLAFADWLEDFPRAEPLVVFCTFVKDIEEVSAQCRKAGRSVSELSGRARELAQWQEGQTEVIVVQVQSGGAGIDLTRASHCVYYSTTWSLGDYEQSLARIRRPGQRKTCRYYHFIATGTVEETIYSALRSKKDVVEQILLRLTRRA